MLDQRHVHAPYVFVALAFALTAGFGYAAIIVAMLALKYSRVPRLRGTTLARIELALWTGCVHYVSRSQRLPRHHYASVGALRGSGTLWRDRLWHRRACRHRAHRRDARVVVSPCARTSRSHSSVSSLLLNLTLSFSSNYIFPSALADVLNHLLINGFVIPIALALPVCNLPLFMRLAAPPKQGLFPIFVLYVTGFVFRNVGYLERAFCSVFAAESRRR